MVVIRWPSANAIASSSLPSRKGERGHVKIDTYVATFPGNDPAKTCMDGRVSAFSHGSDVHPARHLHSLEARANTSPIYREDG